MLRNDKRLQFFRLVLGSMLCRLLYSLTGDKTMRKYQFPVMLVLVILSVSLVQADGLICKLPKDGTWATYLMESTSTVEGKILERVKTDIHIASVGKVTKNGQVCRWIEVTFKSKKESKEDGPEGKTRTRNYPEVFYAFLVPEKHLTKGGTPLKHVTGGWTRRGEGKPHKFKSPGAELPWLPTMLYGPLDNAKPLPKEALESKLGKLLCDGVTGTLDTKDHMGGTLKMKFEDRLHSDAPFGIVSSRCTFETKLRKPAGKIKAGIIKMEWNIKLADYGNDATSKIPDAK